MLQHKWARYNNEPLTSKKAMAVILDEDWTDSGAIERANSRIEKLVKHNAWLVGLLVERGVITEADIASEYGYEIVEPT